MAATVPDLELVYKCVEERENDFKMAAQIGTDSFVSVTAFVLTSNRNRSNVGSKESRTHGRIRSFGAGSVESGSNVREYCLMSDTTIAGNAKRRK